jgi:hypothetical protein
MMTDSSGLNAHASIVSFEKCLMKRTSTTSKRSSHGQVLALRGRGRCIKRNFEKVESYLAQGGAASI